MLERRVRPPIHARRAAAPASQGRSRRRGEGRPRPRGARPARGPRGGFRRPSGRLPSRPADPLRDRRPPRAPQQPARVRPARRQPRRRRHAVVGVPGRRPSATCARPTACCGRRGACSSSTTTGATTSAGCRTPMPPSTACGAGATARSWRPRGSRSASSTASGRSRTLDEARTFLADAFGEPGESLGAGLKRPRLSWNVAIYHRSRGGVDPAGPEAPAAPAAR